MPDIDSMLANSSHPAQRQVGETALNDKSSRSHQIIRLVSKNLESCFEFLPLLSRLSYFPLLSTQLHSPILTLIPFARDRNMMLSNPPSPISDK